MIYLPDILKTEKGETVTAENWQKRRTEILDILSSQEYGYMPSVYGKTVFRTHIIDDETHCSGFVKPEHYDVSFETDKGIFEFPFDLFVPDDGKKHPLFMFMNFNDGIYSRYFPLEEITDRGFAVARIYYGDITSDDEDMSDKLSGMYNRPADGTGYGKISLWAFSISRALDCIIDRDDIDRENIAVIGHSRLGKTALWCGANDERIKYVISNDSGCGGAAYEKTKHEEAETIEDMNRRFPYWFCENRNQYAGNEQTMPFDQHFLLAACAPRNVLVGSAVLDRWADPYSEQISCIAASPAFELFGKGYC